MLTVFEQTEPLWGKLMTHPKYTHVIENNPMRIKMNKALFRTITKYRLGKRPTHFATKDILAQIHA